MATSDSTVEAKQDAMPCRMKSQSHLIANDPRKSNRVMSRVIPPILVAVAIFSCYVWYDMCDSWYLKNGRITTGVCLLVFQVLLLLLMAASFFRITFTPAGYLPNRHDRLRWQADADGQTAAANDYYGQDMKTYDRSPSKSEVVAFMAIPRLYTAPIYLARGDPSDQTRYCSICDVEKYDRVHHCSEVNRCIKKYDHFCPWVGGPLGHTRYKFFFQFITYVALYCVLLAVTLGIAVSQRRRAIRSGNPLTHVPANPGLWYAIIAIASFFALLMIPFSAFHAQQIATNRTTIEAVETTGKQVVVSTDSTNAETGEVTTIRQRITLASSVNSFDLGISRNLQQVLGVIVLDKWLLFRLLNWVLPIQESPGDGLHFPYSNELITETRRQADEALNLPRT